MTSRTVLQIIQVNSIYVSREKNVSLREQANICRVVYRSFARLTTLQCYYHCYLQIKKPRPVRLSDLPKITQPESPGVKSVNRGFLILDLSFSPTFI